MVSGNNLEEHNSPPEYKEVLHMNIDAETLMQNYVESILSQCEHVESQLVASGVDIKFSRLLSIQAAYNSMKQLLIELNDDEAQQDLFKVIEFDIKQIEFKQKPNVLDVGHA
jgi:hypothetical protein